jgi:hypothetical protein
LISMWLLVCFDEEKKDMWGFSWFSSAMHAPYRMMRYHSVWLWAEADQIEESA